MKFLREHEVCEMIGLSRSTLWRLEKKRLEFPKRRQVGSKSVRWLSHEVEAWMKDREVAKGYPHEDPS